MEFGRVQISGGWIDTQCVPVTGGRDTLGRANGSGIEQQLRKESCSFARRGETRAATENLKCRHFRSGWICWQIHHWRALVVTERIGHVLPVEKLGGSPQRFDSVLGSFVIVTPCHGHYACPSLERNL